jgi:hypothetical protein
MLYVIIGGEKVPVPREVDAAGPAAVQGFIDGQQARVAVEAVAPEGE